jgi:hypothetical protein
MLKINTYHARSRVIEASPEPQGHRYPWVLVYLLSFVKLKLKDREPRIELSG